MVMEKGRELGLEEAELYLLRHKCLLRYMLRLSTSSYFQRMRPL